MDTDTEISTKQSGGRLSTTIRRLFWDKKFFHYTWVSGSISVLNVFFLWLLIDVFGIPTVTSGIIVTAGVFILRYVILSLFKIF